jgi:hypothetical protein
MKRLPEAVFFVAAVLSASAVSGQEAPPRWNPATGFDPRPLPSGPPEVNSSVILLPPHGNTNGGSDRGYTNVGIIFGAKIYGGNLATAIELYYYLPSNKDNIYRLGDYRSSTGRIGSNNGSGGAEYFCPEGYAAVGLQGAAGLGVDRIGLVCGKLGNLSQVVALPLFGGKGGDAFFDSCGSVHPWGVLTGVRIRSGAWMDSIQGLCRPATPGAFQTDPPAASKPVIKLADDRAATIAVGASRSDVLENLGEPHSKITGGLERFTYLLQSGGTLKIDFEEGHVTQIRALSGGR